MTSAVFNIHPVGQASITCGYIGSDSVSSDYIVNLPIDWREEERREVLYGDRISNQIKGFNYGTATVTIIIAVGGATVAEVAANARTLERAFSNANGGFIEYKPVDYPDTVLHTYYHYLPAPPPRLIRGKAQTANDNVYGFGLEFQVPIQAWATSDPDNPATLLTDQPIENCQDGTRTNYVTVPSTDLKGDIFFPKLVLVGDYVTTASYEKIIIHKRGMRPGANTDLDWIEGEDMGSFGGPVANAQASGGAYAATSSTPSAGGKTNLGWDSTYAGAYTPIVAAKCSDGTTEWQLDIRAGSTLVAVSQLPAYIDSNFWEIYYQYPELRFPDIKPQHHITDDSTPSFITYTANYSVNFSASRISGSGDLHIDWVLFAKASDFIIILDSDLSVLNNTGVKRLEIDSLSGGVYEVDNTTNPEAASGSWNSKGTPIQDFLLYKGEDSLIRIIGFGESVSNPYDQNFEILVSITGLHGTIYPFDVA